MDVDLIVKLRDEALDHEKWCRDNHTPEKSRFPEVYWTGKVTAFNQALACLKHYDLIRYS